MRSSQPEDLKYDNLVIIQVDVAGSSKYQAPPTRKRRANDIINERLSEIANQKEPKATHTKWDGDGGYFTFLAKKEKDYVEIADKAINFQKKVAELNQEIFDSQGLKDYVKLRISCGEGRVILDKEAGKLTGDFIDAFIKNERKISNTQFATITNDIYNFLPEEKRQQFVFYKVFFTPAPFIFWTIYRQKSGAKRGRFSISTIAKTTATATIFAISLITFSFRESLVSNAGKYRRSTASIFPAEPPLPEPPMKISNSSNRRSSVNPKLPKCIENGNINPSKSVYFNYYAVDQNGGFRDPNVNKENLNALLECMSKKGYDTKDQPSICHAQTVDPASCTRTTNSIYYGSKVAEKFVVEAALAFLEHGGSQIRSIRPFYNNKTRENGYEINRENQIQFGYSFKTHTNCSGEENYYSKQDLENLRDTLSKNPNNNVFATQEMLWRTGCKQDVS